MSTTAPVCIPVSVHAVYALFTLCRPGELAGRRIVLRANEYPTRTRVELCVDPTFDLELQVVVEDAHERPIRRFVGHFSAKQWLAAAADSTLLGLTPATASDECGRAYQVVLTDTLGAAGRAFREEVQAAIRKYCSLVTLTQEQTRAVLQVVFGQSQSPEVSIPVPTGVAELLGHDLGTLRVWRCSSGIGCGFYVPSSGTPRSYTYHAPMAWLAAAVSGNTVSAGTQLEPQISLLLTCPADMRVEVQAYRAGWQACEAARVASGE